MSTRLRDEVWALDRCSGCGACVAACSKGVLRWNDEQHPLLEEREKTLGLSRLKLRACEVCQRFCELSCPRLVEWPVRRQGTLVSARATGVVHSGETNDVIRALLVAARSAELIDGVVMLDLDPWAVEPVTRVAASVEEIASTVGMQYLWAPVLSALNEAIFERGLTRLAVVGPPCVAQGARRLSESEHERLWPYREAIRALISPFCTGIYLPSMITDLLGSGMGIDRHQIRELRVRPRDSKLAVTLWSGAQIVVPLTEVEPYTRHGCGHCDDYVGRAADVSIGTIGSAEGWATVVTNTQVGEILLQNAQRFQLVEMQPGVDEQAIRAAQLEKDRRIRAQVVDELKILMLDALAEPQKRAAVRRELVELYGTTPLNVRVKEECDGYCDGC
jgi:coenzyme F420 hydrogenase subunit beta